MILLLNNQYNPNFHAIQLNAKDAKSAQFAINKLLDTNLNYREKQTLQNSLFNIFDKQLQNEAKIKTRTTLLYEEVLAELYLKFTELLNSIKNNATLEYLVYNLNKFKPSDETQKPEYICDSLDKPVIQEKNSATLGELITENNLPNPTSAIDTEKHKRQLNSVISKTKLSQTAKERLQKRINGAEYKTIAQEEGVSERVIYESVRKSILKMQKNNKNLPIEYIDKIRLLANLLGCDEEKITKVVLKHTDLLSKKIETIEQNIKKSAELLGCSEKTFIQAAIQQPTLLLMKPETIMQHVQSSAKILNCSPKVFIEKALKKGPDILVLAPETLAGNIEKSVIKLGCTKNEFIKAGLNDPTILHMKPRRLLKNVRKSSNFLHCSIKDFVAACLKQPTLFYTKPGKIKNNVRRATKLFGCTFDDYVTIGLKYGSLLYQKPSTLKNNVHKSAELLNISEEEFVQLALKHPPLFYQKPDKIKDNAERMAEILNLSVREYIDKISKRPSILSQKPETLEAKMQIVEFYQKVKNEKPQKIIVQSADNRLYEQILAYLIQKLNNPEFEEFVKVKRKFNFENFLKSNSNRNFYFEIPEDAVTGNFVKFVQETSVKVIGKNIFEFKIIE